LSISAGDRIGPYTVAEKIGEGGMGEVFRAHDSRLKRDAALKVLPASAVGAADRRRRFEREAQVLAALDHPFIARVYGVELDGDEPIIVMEFVDGATLADRLRRGALPVEEAISIALQLCDGLEAAHERNVIHRDLKPANIKVRPDGTIKILDFGIARVLSTDTVVDTANSPTMLGGSTDAGIILGTAAYMSPEQARGRVVDKRADIWAFGCILYEMLVGKAVFTGESTTDILADVVKADPDWAKLPPATPPRVIEVLKRCLQKHPKDRLRDIADARYEIEHAGQPAAHSAAAAAPATASWASSVGWLVAGAAIAAAVLLVAVPRRAGDAAPPAPVRSAIVLPPHTALALGRGSSVIVSPDGRTIAYTARAEGKTQLYLRPLDRFESTMLAGTDDASNPFFSPDGRWIGFFADEKLKKVSIDGGAPVLVAEAINPRGHAWSADDTVFVTTSNNAGISRVPARGGKLEPYTTLQKGELSHRWPMVLPDGKTMLFSVWNDAGWEVSRIAAHRGYGIETVPVVEIGGGFPRYVPDSGGRGYLVYARSEGLLAAGFDESTIALTTQSIPVVDGVLTNLSGGAHFDVSPTGTLAYVPGSFEENERDLVWVSREGKPLSPPQTMRGLTRTFELSPDGTKVIRNTTGDIWIEELGNGRTTRVTTSPDAGNYNGIWSRDGSFVVFSRGLATNVDIFLRQADGSGEKRLTSTPRPKVPVSISADGRWLSYNEFDPVTLGDIWIVEIATGQTRPFLKTDAAESFGAFSADGKWMLYQSNDTGRFEIYAKPIAGGQAVRVSTNGGTVGLWSPRTNEILYRGNDTRIYAVPVRIGETFDADKPRALFEARVYENAYKLSADGQRLLMMPLTASETSSSRINIVQNFITELRQRVR
jgi:eukaryotic-like serine/threonine-protein kinase